MRYEFTRASHRSTPQPLSMTIFDHPQSVIHIARAPGFWGRTVLICLFNQFINIIKFPVCVHQSPEPGGGIGWLILDNQSKLYGLARPRSVPIEYVHRGIHSYIKHYNNEAITKILLIYIIK